MNNKNIFIICWSFTVTLLLVTNCLARDLAGIEWTEFKNRSEFIFAGYLVKAELIGDYLNEPEQEIYYTYQISNVFKGEKLTKVSFKAPVEENINKIIGRVAIVALKKNRNEWVLSVDERSCWAHENEMKKDFGGFPVYKIPTVLLYNFPEELGEKVELKKRYGDDYRNEEVFVYPMHKINKSLEKYLN